MGWLCIWSPSLMTFLNTVVTFLYANFFPDIRIYFIYCFDICFLRLARKL